jgi:hypothetical protein
MGSVAVLMIWVVSFNSDRMARPWISFLLGQI